MKVLKKVLFIIIITFSFNISVYAFDVDLDIQSNEAILYNLNDDSIIYEVNSKEEVQIASLTKIMTAIVALENIDDLDETVTLTSEDFTGLSENNLVTAGFYTGQTVTYRDLLYGLLLPSGADCAKALERLVSDNFIDLMNEKAKEIGMENTNFSNSIGLDDENNYSTAYDVSLMFKYALENTDFKTIITTSSYTVADGSITFKSKVKENSIVGSYIQGGKTGTTTEAGLCLASIASYDGVSYLLVTLGAPYDKKGSHNLEDAKTIYDYFINNYGYQTIYSEGDEILSLNTKYASISEVKFYAKEDITLYLPNDYDKDNVVYEYDGIELLTTDLEKGSNLGTLTISYDDISSDVSIVLDEELNFSIIEFLKVNYKIVLGIIFVIIIIGGVYVKKHKHA